MTTNRFSSFATIPAFALTAALALAGCGASAISQLPADAHVDHMQADRLVLRGTARVEKSPSCSETALPASHLVEFANDMTGKIGLRAAPSVSSSVVLHVKNLDTNKVWCMTSKSDGTLPSIPGEFAGGTYAITVSETSASPYEIVVEKL